MVDWIVGLTSTKNKLGVGVYLEMLYKHLSEKIDINIIESPQAKLPILSETVSVDLLYPLKIAQKVKKGTLVHILSQGNSHLLNYPIKALENSVVTCHDIYSVLYPSETILTRLQGKFQLRGMKKSKMIISVSEYTKNELIKVLKISEEKIKVIHLGVDTHLFKKKIAPRPDNTKNILFVGSSAPWKNLHTLVKAIYKVRKKLPNVKLVKIGPTWKGEEKLIELIRKLNLDDTIKFVGYVPDKDLPNYYSSADVFVFPSLYEGFGFPPLEAMACGCPVISSNAASIPETVGNAGIMVNPMDVDGLAEAIIKVLTNDALKEEMIKKGLKRAQEFNWEKTARETLKVYEEMDN